MFVMLLYQPFSTPTCFMVRETIFYFGNQFINSFSYCNKILKELIVNLIAILLVYVIK